MKNILMNDKYLRESTDDRNRPIIGNRGFAAFVKTETMTALIIIIIII
jgi:hypothetical protein